MSAGADVEQLAGEVPGEPLPFPGELRRSRALLRDLDRLGHRVGRKARCATRICGSGRPCRSARNPSACRRAAGCDRRVDGVRAEREAAPTCSRQAATSRRCRCPASRRRHRGCRSRWAGRAAAGTCPARCARSRRCRRPAVGHDELDGLVRVAVLRRHRTRWPGWPRRRTAAAASDARSIRSLFVSCGWCRDDGRCGRLGSRRGIAHAPAGEQLLGQRARLGPQNGSIALMPTAANRLAACVRTPGRGPQTPSRHLAVLGPALAALRQLGLEARRSR